MNEAIIAGDIIAYTSLSSQQKEILEKELKNLFRELQDKYQVFIRLVNGDYLECVVEKPEKSLEIALLIKTFVKSLKFDQAGNDKRIKFFNKYGIRLVVSIGNLERFDAEKGIIDGEAIYRAGRLINEQSTHDKQKIHIKQSLFFISQYDELNKEMDTLFNLVDFILTKATDKQARIIHRKIWGESEKEIAQKLKISHSSVNRHSIAAGWRPINKTLKYYSGKILKVIY